MIFLKNETQYIYHRVPGMLRPKFPEWYYTRLIGQRELFGVFDPKPVSS